MQRISFQAAALVFVAAAAASAQAQKVDTYFVKEFGQLKLTEGRLDRAASGREDDFYAWSYWRAARLPYAVLDGGNGEIYVGALWREFSNPQRRVAIAAPKGQKVSGRIFMPDPDRADRMISARFEIAAEEGKPELREAFLDVKHAHYQRLLSADLPGAAWFRHQAYDTQRALGRAPDSWATQWRGGFASMRNDRMEDTFALATGGQALAENLQLDRVLPQTRTFAETIKVSDIEGITVKPFDWAPLIEGKSPRKDALAELIPADQHALFFPSFDAMMQVADHVDRFGTPIVRAAEPRSDESGLRDRYERQLCIPASTLSRILGPRLIQSVAVTGGDSYLRMGSDVAVLFEAKDSSLHDVLLARIALAAGAQAKPSSGRIAGVDYQAFRTDDRAVCSYIAQLDNVVVVTNSPAQLERLIAVRDKKATALAGLPEYKFFRDRYALGDAGESGLLILSDDTIRRWCSPRWRIADSRRTRAAAVMSELQAAHLDRIVKKTPEALAAESYYPAPDAGKFHVHPTGVRSSVYGSLDFMTPIAELDMPIVTQEEARLYGAWRDGYQRYWSNFFDPIAVRMYVRRDKLALDMTVMPLIDQSDYRRYIDVAGASKIAPFAGDPHPEAALHWLMAVDPKSERVRREVEFLPTFDDGPVKVNALSWLGSSMAIYADRDPFWDDLAKHLEKHPIGDGSGDTWGFMLANLHRIPVAVRAEVRDPLKLTLFLAGVRKYIDEAAPGMTAWEVREHAGVKYTRIGLAPSRADSFPNADKTALYYGVAGDGLTVTFREDLLHRAIDRHAARAKAEAAKDPAKPDGDTDATALVVGAKPWSGDHWCIRIDQSALTIIDSMSSSLQREHQQALAFANLPILNEWRRLYPGEDPIKLHERLWGRKLVCPGGGKYRWNDEWQTMESTVYGHPGEPKAGPTIAAGLRDLTSGEAGLTFEPNGLRVRLGVTRATDAKRGDNGVSEK